MTRNYNIIDAHDELRRIGPQLGAAVRELDRLCERLPMRLVERIEAAAPEITQVDLAAIGPKLSALAQVLADEVDALPEVRVDALVEQIDARRKALRQPRLAWGNPPGIRSENVLPLSRLDAIRGDDTPPDAA